MEYIILPNEKHVAYSELYPLLNFIECAMVTAWLGGEIYLLDQKKFYASLRTEWCDCGLSWINIHWKFKDGRADWAFLTIYYYGSESRETAISAIIGNIEGTRLNGEGSGQSYEKVTGKIRDCFQQLEAIGKDAAIRPAQQVFYLLN